ncbi:hypothetical protein ABID08_000166 [Rhizobium binae]|uniref:Uncharacterized protein n=1 Tax=Rhizobium binae TaxID=1138190 RepID=A0ABV2M8M8_9HYPH
MTSIDVVVGAGIAGTEKSAFADKAKAGFGEG